MKNCASSWLFTRITPFYVSYHGLRLSSLTFTEFLHILLTNAAMQLQIRSWPSRFISNNTSINGR